MLRYEGRYPAATTYRLIEIPLASIKDSRTMSGLKNLSQSLVDTLRSGAEFPPIVVTPVIAMSAPSAWTVIDGAYRTYAYRAMNRLTYELAAETAHP